MISIWFWVGAVLGVYGLVITGAGVYYMFRPETATALAHLNPSLWWGLVMLLAGVIFAAAGRFGRRSPRTGSTGQAGADVADRPDQPQTTV